ncbi:MAG: CvpA family protein [Pseudomonadota bacterium]
MGVNTLDLIILAVIGFSSLISLYRGFSSEFLSLVTWIVALWLPFNYTEQFMAFLPASVESQSARWFISAGALFLGALIVGGVLSWLIRKVVGSATLGFTDKLLGLGLGAVRGLLILAIVAMLATSNPAIPKESWWNESRLLPFVLKVSNVIKSQLPSQYAAWFSH